MSLFSYVPLLSYTLLDKENQNIVEFGTGLSTFIIGLICNNCSFTSYETSWRWYLLYQIPNIFFKLPFFGIRATKNTRIKLYRDKDIEKIVKRITKEKTTLVFIDGGHRQQILNCLIKYGYAGYIVIHDTSNPKYDFDGFNVEKQYFTTALLKRRTKT